MARNPTATRQYSTGGTNSKSFFLNRDGNTINVISADRGSIVKHDFPSVTAAKKAMNQPSSIVQ